LSEKLARIKLLLEDPSGGKGKRFEFLQSRQLTYSVIFKLQFNRRRVRFDSAANHRER
jgi:hypothetical protein